MATLNWPGFAISAISPSLDQPSTVNKSAYTRARSVAANPWHGAWSFKVTLATMQGDAAFQAARAFFTSLQGQVNNFHLPAVEAPQNGNTSVTLSAAAAQGAISLALTGLTTALVAGNMVTIAGQLLSITNVGTLTAGAQTISFQAALRAAALSGASVETAKPYALVALNTSSFSWDIGQWRLYGLTFQADEAIGDTDGASPALDIWTPTIGGSGSSGSSFSFPQLTSFISRSLLAAVASPTDKQLAYLTEAGREGVFVFSTANLSTQVSADTQQGVYVAPSAAPTGSSGAWVRKNSGERDVRWFGAKGDGTTDDSTALTAFVTHLAANGLVGRLTAGSYLCSSAQTWPVGAKPWGIAGDGSSCTTLLYNGASTTNDVLSIGDGTNQVIRRQFSGFTVRSNTTMTAGAGLHAKLLCRSDLRDIVIDGQDGNGKLWNGIWFDQLDDVDFDDFEVSAQNELLIVNGAVSGPKADLFLDNGKICPANGKTASVGVHVAGAFGGLEIGKVDIIGCGTNMIVDTALVAESNREITFGAGSALDSSTTGPNLLLNDSGTGTLYIAGAGAWFGSAATHNIQINNTSTNYDVDLAGGRIYNAVNDGLHNSSGGAQVTISGTEVRGNAGTGIANPGVGNIRTANVRFASNGADTSGFVLSNISPGLVTIANGSSVAIGMSSGLLGVCLTNAGNGSALYACGGGSALLGSSTAAWVASTTTPASGKASVAYNGSAYAIYNNTGASVVVSWSAIQLNTGV